MLIAIAIIVTYVLWVHPPFLNPSINFYDYSADPSTTPVQIGILKLDDEFVFDFGDQEKKRSIIAITTKQGYKIFYEGSVTSVVGVYGNDVYYLSSTTLYRYQGKITKVFMRNIDGCVLHDSYLYYKRGDAIYRYNIETNEHEEIYRNSSISQHVFHATSFGFYLDGSSEGEVFNKKGELLREETLPGQTKMICYMDEEKTIAQDSDNVYYWIQGDNIEQIFISPRLLTRPQVTSRYIVARIKDNDEVFLYDYINKKEEILYQTECRKVVVDGDDIYLIPQEPFDKDKNIHYYWLNTESMSLEPRMLQKSK